jgi:hypothetical protein
MNTTSCSGYCARCSTPPWQCDVWKYGDSSAVPTFIAWQHKNEIQYRRAYQLTSYYETVCLNACINFVCIILYDYNFHFWGAFAKLRRASISFVMNVCLSAWNDSAPTGRIVMKFYVWVFFQKSVGKKLIFMKLKKKYKGYFGVRGGTVGRGTALQVGRLRIRFSIMSFEFFTDIILPATLWPWGWFSL